MRTSIQIILIILSLYSILSCGRDTQVLPSSQKEGEAQIVDTDTDGLVDSEDNCPTIANPDQNDSDGNGKGDLCNDAKPEEQVEKKDGDEVENKVEDDKDEPTGESKIGEKETVASANSDKNPSSYSISAGSGQIIAIATTVTTNKNGNTTSGSNNNCSGKVASDQQFEKDCQITEKPDISKYTEIIIFPEPPVEFDSATVSTQDISNEAWINYENIYSEQSDENNSDSDAGGIDLTAFDTIDVDGIDKLSGLTLIYDNEYNKTEIE